MAAGVLVAHRLDPAFAAGSAGSTAVLAANLLGAVD
jgi:hypothetical protein